MERKEAIQRLAHLTKTIVKAGVGDVGDYRDWVEEDGEDILDELFAYERKDGMPAVHALVKPFFHPRLPYVGWNYTPVAHNRLYLSPDGWTMPIRQCRGLIFRANGQLLAKPFEKFFNAGEHPETRELPNEPFTVMEKHDGHLGIVFRADREVRVATRGSFRHSSAAIAREMIKTRTERGSWRKHLPEGLTVLVEIIHPKTHVIRTYRKPRLVLIGAFDNATLHDFPYGELRLLGRLLGLPVAETWAFTSLSELGHHVTENVENQEGFVVRFDSGLRVKFKYQTYIGKMVAAKLSYPYVVRRLIAGDWQVKMDLLPEEVLPAAREMQTRILTALDDPKGLDALYELPPDSEQTSNYREQCRKLLVKKEASGVRAA